MIDKILEKVQENISGKIVEETGIEASQVPQALQSVSSAVMSKAKGILDQGNIMELKDIFTGSDSTKRDAFLSEMKTEISENLQTDLNLSPTQASSLVTTSIPEIIRVSKEQLLGPDGKIGLDDLPRLMSFFKSEGKETKSGGLGGLFGL